MEKKILGCKLIFILFMISYSCKDLKEKDIFYKEKEEIENAIDLVKNSKLINDTLIKYKTKFRVEFLPCYIRQTNNHYILGFQNIYSNGYKTPPIKIDRFYKIKNINGIDIFFLNVDLYDKEMGCIPNIDEKTKVLISKKYLTIKGGLFLNDGYSIHFVFCKNNKNKCRVLTTSFVGSQELKARKENKPFIIENLYPKCD